MARPNEEIYRVKVISRKLGGTDKAIKAWAPEEMTFSVESTWDSPFESMASALSTAAAAVGFSVQTKEHSTQVWKGTSPIQITMPLRFFAESRDTKDADLIDPVMNLMKMAVPDLNKNGTFLDPPGPIISRVENVLSVAGIDSDSEHISIEVGKFIRFPNVIISSVNVIVPLRLTEDGSPLTMTAEITFRTFDVITKPDIEVIFNRGGSSG